MPKNQVHVVGRHGTRLLKDTAMTIGGFHGPSGAACRSHAQRQGSTGTDIQR
ncbi:MAG: hypothetical protein NTY08_18530 [Proteobacteria bacterium]|nr:hypothetical protein [Pseudomonadota bacterium]